MAIYAFSCIWYYVHWKRFLRPVEVAQTHSDSITSSTTPKPKLCMAEVASCPPKFTLPQPLQRAVSGKGGEK